MPLPAAFKKNAEKKKEEGEVREGEKDTEEKKPPFAKKSKGKQKKETKDTEIIPGGEGSEGVTKMNDPRKKGAPSLDDENNDACTKKDGKKGKDCGCEHKNDSLTPQEYVAACDLGIQDRSRTYIRARLDAEQRVDVTGSGTGKKCGASHIPKASTCTKGAGGGSAPAKKEPRLKDFRAGGGGRGSAGQKANQKFWNTPGSTKGVGNKLKRGAEAAANVGATLKMAQAGSQFVQGKYGKSVQSVLTAGTLSSVAGQSRAQRQGNKGLASDFGKQARNLSIANSGISLARGLASGQTQYSAKQAYNRAADFGSRMGRRATSYTTTAKPGWSTKLPKKKKDSVWADGFSHLDAESALTANSMNLATDKYSKEKRKKNAQGQPRNTIIANTFNT